MLSVTSTDRNSRAVPRSFLYVPGHREDLVAKAAHSGADALVVDLEDAVGPADKSLARRVVADWLGAPPPAPERWVRISGDVLADDLDALTGHAPDGLFLATCRRVGLDRLEGWLTDAGMTDCRVVGLVEDAAGLLELPRLGDASHLLTVGIGMIDLLADLRISPRATAAVDALRLDVVVGAAAAGLAAPVAPTSPDFRDLDAFRTSTRALVDAGFRSRTAIHPAQVAVVNEVLTPTADELAEARDVIDRFDRADGGVTTDARGAMIDLAVVRAARETVDRSQRTMPSSRNRPTSSSS